MKRIRCIAWDFDGVLNRNVVNGYFIWKDRLADFGIEKEVFEKFMFSDGYWPVMRGEEDLLDRLKRFRKHAYFAADAEELMHYWFAHDAHPCADMLGLMQRVQAAGIRQIIATNNEHRRSSYIEHEMGFGERIEKLFSSGRMGAAKPDAAYFRTIQEEMGLKPEEILLVDDYGKNIDGAAACGWQVHHFPENGHADLAQRLAVIL